MRPEVEQRAAKRLLEAHERGLNLRRALGWTWKPRALFALMLSVGIVGAIVECGDARITSGGDASASSVAFPITRLSSPLIAGRSPPFAFLTSVLAMARRSSSLELPSRSARGGKIGGLAAPDPR